MKKLSECEKQCSTNISRVLQHQGLLRASCMQATSMQLSRKFETHIPKETLLNKVNCKFVVMLYKVARKQNIGAPEYQHYEWNTCGIIFQQSCQVHRFILCQNNMMFLFVL